MSNTNRLINETSPYLLQHAHNPVDWYPWGEEAFSKAKAEDKPVLVSIGYAACHWCHVMERESFEDPEVAEIMNRHFVNIKVDREERPDVDHIYMDALQAIAGNGGWPLNMFLTPDRKPFYGGTYFPPRRAHNRASWREVLLAISDAYQNKKDEISQQAEQLTEHMRNSEMFKAASDSPVNLEGVHLAFQNIMKQADTEWGGFGRAPKFPQTFTISFLLAYGHLQKIQEAVDQALLSLDKMMEGGIYDQVGGGFARYSTDTEWLAPHFEKMLYDNALIVMALADALQLTGKEEYRQTIDETLAFVERELMHPSGGFFSALDADSEGVEGKFYVWDRSEVQEVLGADAELFCNYFDISEKGNWSHGTPSEEHKNIPRILKRMPVFAKEHSVDPQKLRDLIQRGKEKLLERRSQRVRPLLDDKVLLGWNALMNIAYVKAYNATGNRHYLDVARRNMEFMLTAFGEDTARMNHSWKNGIARHPAFLDDYSHLVSALIHFAQATADFSYFHRAADFTKVVLKHFADTATPFFFYTHADQQDILLRKKEIYDGATPSGNSMMALNLYHLSVIFDVDDWRKRAGEMTATIGELAVKYPTSFGLWLSLMFEMVMTTNEIAIIGPGHLSLLEKISLLFVPHKLVMAADQPLNEFPLLAGKPDDSENHIYVCKNYSCKKPVSTINEFVKLL